MTNTKRCRACKAQIKVMGWQQHILKHKRAFCRLIGRFEGEAWKINWEDVVLYFNPEEAKKDKCIGYPVPKHKKIGDFDKK